MSQQDGNVDPNLRLFGDSKGKTRYPSPFFDLSQQFIPPSVKELFKWVYFYATNNSFIGPALNKIARYPITDLIFEDNNHELVERWKTLLNTQHQIKLFNMETNLDLVTYGNAFVTIHYPFTRFLVCASCKDRVPWKAAQKKIENLKIKMKCAKCGSDREADIYDSYYKSEQHIKLLRINPEFIDIKYNDTTGRHTYLYSIPDKLKRQIMSGDPDILEDTPKIYLDAIKQRKKIKLSNQNLFHLKRPTLAGKDMGWGVPLLATALKDLYYFYTLRRGQEAIINEHIVPFDVIFPQANGKYDPYVHTDLSNWKREIEGQLAKKRRDPNYKAVLPFPVGFERIGGDGKALMLTPELDFLSKSIIGSVGIPQEFVHGGNMQWSGSSISLRTLENDFLHHRSQIVQMDIWIIERFRLYLGIPAPKSCKMSDFKMADDVQMLQVKVGMASNNKLDWDTILKDLGYDPEAVRTKIKKEKEFDSELMEIDLMHQAEAQAKSQRIQMRQQAAMQQEAQGIQMRAAQDAMGASEGQLQTGQEETVAAMANRLATQDPSMQVGALTRLNSLDPKFAAAVRAALAQATAPQVEQVQRPPQPQQSQQQPGADMRPMPTQKPPRRQGGI